MAKGADDSAGEDDSEWRFSLEDIEQMNPAGSDADDESGGNITGSLGTSGPLEPDSIDRENALFVVLGVVGTLLVFFGFYVTLL